MLEEEKKIIASRNKNNRRSKKRNVFIIVRINQSFSSESTSDVPSTLATDKRNFISLVNFGMNSRGTRNEARLNKSIKIL
jgi:hypothetical protein